MEEVKKNVLIYSHVALWEVHHVESVEIALQQVKKDHRVFLLTCDGTLKSCPANPFHDEHICERCKLQSDYTQQKILDKNVTWLNINLRGYKYDMPIFNDLEQFIEFKYEDVPIGRLVLSQIITDRRDSQIKFEEIKTRAIQLVHNAIELYERSKLIIENNLIDTVYVWNGRRCSDGPVVYAAKHLKKKYYVHILAGKGDENIYISNTTAVHDLQNNIENIDKYIDKEKKGLEYIVEEGHRFFELIRSGGIAAHSYKNFTTNFVSDDVQINRTKDKVISIFPSSFWEYYSMNDYLHENESMKYHYQVLRDLLQNEYIKSKYDIVIRWHPNLATCGKKERETIDKIILETAPHCVHFTPESSLNSYKLLEYADVVITFGSTIGIEAAYYGKPSILLGRALYEKTNSVYTPNSINELIEILKNDPQPLDNLGAIKYGYYIRNKGKYKIENFHKVNNHWYYENKPLKYKECARKNNKKIHKKIVNKIKHIFQIT